jgi:hypothetical protein
MNVGELRGVVSPPTAKPRGSPTGRRRTSQPNAGEKKEVNESLFTSGEAAAALNLPRWRFLYLIERGDLPEPSYEVPGRRLFTSEDIERLKQALAARPAAGATELERAPSKEEG